MRREQLAAYAHEAWSGWTDHLLGKGRLNADGSVTLSAPYVVALNRLVHLAYADLSEPEKDSDRAEADRMIEIVAANQPTTAMYRFQLQRDQDITGVSGTGVVAEGVVLTSGRVVMEWLTAINSIVIYPAIANVEAIHGHDGATRIVWLDEEGE